MLCDRHEYDDGIKDVIFSSDLYPNKRRGKVADVGAILMLVVYGGGGWKMLLFDVKA